MSTREGTEGAGGNDRGGQPAIVLERATAGAERRDRELALVARETEALRRALDAATQRAGEPTHLLRVVSEEAARRRALLARRASATDVAALELEEAADDLAAARRRLREVEGRLEGLRRRLRLIAFQADPSLSGEQARRALGTGRGPRTLPADPDDPLVFKAGQLLRLAGRCRVVDDRLDEAWSEELALRRVFDRDVSDEDRGVPASALEAVADLLRSSIPLDELAAELLRQAHEAASRLVTVWSDIAQTWEREAAARSESSRLAGVLDGIAGTVVQERRHPPDGERR